MFVALATWMCVMLLRLMIILICEFFEARLELIAELILFLLHVDCILKRRIRLLIWILDQIIEVYVVILSFQGQ